MKEKREVLFVSFLLTVFSSFFVSAASFDFDDTTEQVARGIDFVLGIAAPVFEAIIGDYSSSEFFFSKILLLVLLVIIIKNVLERTPFSQDNEKLSFVISLILSILSIRFINQNDFFEAIFVQYGVLGIAITTILPMVVFFYFIHNTNVKTFGRKMFWGLYSVILFVLWISRASELPEAANWIYGLSFVLAIVFILGDKQIHGYFGINEFLDYKKRADRERMRNLKRRLNKIDDYDDKGANKTYQDKKDYRDERREILRDIKDLAKEQ